MSPLLRHTAHHLLKNWRMGIPVILVIAFAFLLFNLLLFTNHIGNKFLNVLKGSLSFTVYVREDIDPFTLREFISDLEKLPEVKSPVTYLSPEGEAISLPGSIIITPKEPDGRKTIENYLEKSPYRPFLTLPSRQTQTAEGKTYERVTTQVERLQKLIRGIVFGLLLFAMLVIVTVIFASLKLGSYSRKTELAIMKMVGASPTFLEFPYFLEAISYSVLGLIAGSIFFLLIPSLGILPSDAFLQEEWKNFSFGNVFVFELAIALLLGFVAAFFSLHSILWDISKKRSHLF